MIVKNGRTYLWENDISKANLYIQVGKGGNTNQQVKISDEELNDPLETGENGVVDIWYSKKTLPVISDDWKTSLTDTDTSITDYLDKDTRKITIFIKIVPKKAIQLGEMGLFVETTGSETPEPVDKEIVSPETSPPNQSGDLTDAILGAEEKVIKIEAIKNSGTGLGLYNDFRLYGYRQTGDGSSLAISVAEGYKISSIQFVFGASQNNVIGTLQFDDEAKTDLLFSELTNRTQTYTDLNATLVTLQNIGDVTTNATANGQIRINSIVVTYVALPTGNTPGILISKTMMHKQTLSNSETKILQYTINI